MTDERHAALAQRAERALAGRPVAEAVAKVRAIVFKLPLVPDAETAAQTALNKINAGEAPTAAELAALELVVRMMRPAPLSKDGELEPLPSAPGSSTYNPALVALWDRFRAGVKPLMYSIGRLEDHGGDPQGTGFLVGDDLLLTNRHVLAKLSNGVEELDDGQAVVRFNQEWGMPDPADSSVPVAGVAAVHDTLDMALLRVRLPQPRKRLALDNEPAERASAVATVGYPFKDPTSPLFVEAIFNGRYGVKRAAIGDVLDVGERRFFHDCSTLGGNSGSPVFSLDSGGVAGIHCSGVFNYRNEAIPATEIAAFMEA
jgi:S1-C subfamily serine protease